MRSRTTVVPAGTSTALLALGTNWPSSLLTRSRTVVGSSPGLVTWTRRAPGPCGRPATVTAAAGGGDGAAHSTPRAARPATRGLQHGGDHPAPAGQHLTGERGGAGREAVHPDDEPRARLHDEPGAGTRVDGALGAPQPDVDDRGLVLGVDEEQVRLLARRLRAADEPALAPPGAPQRSPASPRAAPASLRSRSSTSRPPASSPVARTTTASSETSPSRPRTA